MSAIRIGPIAGLLLVAASSVNHAAAAGDETHLTVGAGDLRVVIGEQASMPERRAAALFAQAVRARTGLDVPIVPGSGGAVTRYSLWIGTRDSLKPGDADKTHDEAIAALGTDGFYLACLPDAAGRLFLIGADPGNVVAGIGKLLRTSRYAQGSLEIPRRTFADKPVMPVRGIYFATHFFNFYHAAPLEEVDPVIEECALWGLNQLAVWFDMHHFTGIDTPEARKHLERLKHFQKTAHDVGMQFGVVFLGNEGYSNTPKELLARYRPRWSHYHVEVCPATPEGMALIARNQSGVLDAFRQVDFTWTWPYDQGGCDCDKCRPWGANGFLKVSEQLARLFHERDPKGKLWLSTWFFDSHAADGRINGERLVTDVEYPGLMKYLSEKKPDWLAGIIAGGGGDFLPAPLLARPLPDRYPLVTFPEISMYRMNPWGGCGANPMPDVCGRLAAKLRGRIAGGWPYSEGIFEDLNKFFWAGFFWSPDRPAEDILTEYANYYLSPQTAADGVRLFHLLEKTLPRNEFTFENLAEADEAWRLAEAIDAKIPPVNRTAWRWRVLYIRAKVDHIIKNQGYKSDEARAALRPLFKELVEIYHAENSFICPPKLQSSEGGK